MKRFYSRKAKILLAIACTFFFVCFGMSYIVFLMIDSDNNQKEIQDAYEAGQKDGIDSVIECLDNKSLEKLAGLTETEYNVTQ